MKGKFSDLVNSGSRYGGACNAAAFLKEFLDEGREWAHIDIAGPSNAMSDYSFYKAGPTGFGVRMLVDYLKAKQAK